MFTCLVASFGSNPIAIRVAAAANLSGTLNRIAAGFVSRRNDIAVDIAFGSSGALAAHIRSGASYNLFLSADTVNPDKLAAAGFTVGTTREYAQGALCVVSPLGVSSVGELNFLTGEEYRRIAIAQPELAPYGTAALDAMRSAYIWPELEERMIFAANVAQVGRLVLSGEADAGFINLSAILGDESFASIPWICVDSSLYTPIRQGAVVLKGEEKSTRAALEFLEYLFSSDADASLFAAGYSRMPGVLA